MSYKSPLARARGLGSAKEGVGHWWAQRLTAVALIPLSLWFAAAVVANTGADHATMVAWLGSPVVAVLMVLLIWATFHHAQLGIQVILEDYVHNEAVKFAAIIAVKFAAILLGALAGFAVLRVAFAG